MNDSYTPHVNELLLTDLRHLVGALGRGGGEITPAVYDTAMCLRFLPPSDGVGAALQWLLSQQHEDGGWGDPAVPRARIVPSLAAILALQALGRRSEDAIAVTTGIGYHSTASPLRT